MGTNFYHRYNHCDCCGRYDERHIGKSLVMFRGYRPDPDWPDEFTGPVLDSWQAWKAELLAGGEVWDEYGHREETAAFIEAVEATAPDRRARQFRWMEHHALDYGLSMESDWLDADGFSFCDREFS